MEDNSYCRGSNLILGVLEEVHANYVFVDPVDQYNTEFFIEIVGHNSVTQPQLPILQISVPSKI